MDRSKPWYLTERAELLATVMLTRSPKLSLWRPAPNSEIDFLVSVSGNRGGRVFGLVIEADTTLAAHVSPDHRVLPAVIAQLQKVAGDTPFPTGVLIFDMSNDSGYFGWFIGPGSGPGQLSRHEEIEVNLVDDHLLDAIVAEVDEWYDARAQLMTRSA